MGHSSFFEEYVFIPLLQFYVRLVGKKRETEEIKEIKAHFLHYNHEVTLQELCNTDVLSIDVTDKYKKFLTFKSPDTLLENVPLDSVLKVLLKDEKEFENHKARLEITMKDQWGDTRKWFLDKRNSTTVDLPFSISENYFSPGVQSVHLTGFDKASFNVVQMNCLELLESIKVWHPRNNNNQTHSYKKNLVKYGLRDFLLNHDEYADEIVLSGAENIDITLLYTNQIQMVFSYSFKFL